jgi:hypothetical protein
LNEYPDEKEELALIYHARGMDSTRRGGNRDLVRNPPPRSCAAREELGLNPDDLVALGAAAFSFASFSLALLPLLPSS